MWYVNWVIKSNNNCHIVSSQYQDIEHNYGDVNFCPSRAALLQVQRISLSKLLISAPQCEKHCWWCHMKVSATNFVFDFAQKCQLIVTPTVRKWGTWPTHQNWTPENGWVENPDLNPMTVDRRTHMFSLPSRHDEPYQSCSYITKKWVYIWAIGTE